MQSKLKFIAFQKSYDNYDSYTIKQNGILIGKPKFIGFTILDFLKLLVNETFSDKLQKCYGEKRLSLCCMATVSILLSVNTNDFIENSFKTNDFFQYFKRTSWYI